MKWKLCSFSSEMDTLSVMCPCGSCEPILCYNKPRWDSHLRQRPGLACYNKGFGSVYLNRGIFWIGCFSKTKNNSAQKKMQSNVFQLKWRLHAKIQLWSKKKNNHQNCHLSPFMTSLFKWTCWVKVVSRKLHWSVTVCAMHNVLILVSSPSLKLEKS